MQTSEKEQATLKSASKLAEQATSGHQIVAFQKFNGKWGVLDSSVGEYCPAYSSALPKNAPPCNCKQETTSHDPPCSTSPTPVEVDDPKQLVNKGPFFLRSQCCHMPQSPDPGHTVVTGVFRVEDIEKYLGNYRAVDALNNIYVSGSADLDECKFLPLHQLRVSYCRAPSRFRSSTVSVKPCT